MPCSQCVGESRRDALRQFWNTVPNADKRQVITGAVGVAGASTGWFLTGLLGGLVGMFLGGCAGGIVGLARYKSGDSAPAESAQLAGQNGIR